MRTKTFLGLLMGLSLVACNKQDDVVKPIDVPERTKSVIAADNSFGFDLYLKLAAEAEKGTNMMISPLSVSQALAMTYNGANGETKAAMEEALRVAGIDRDELNELNKTLVDALLNHDPKVVLEIANSIWYRNDFTVLPDFIQRNQTYYGAEVSSLDFSDPGSKDVINGWVDEKTHGKISEIVKEINPESFMFLINAIYFKGTWTYEFAKKNTRESQFYLEDGSSVPVEMMNQEMDLNTFQTDVFTSVELPYGKGNWRMFLFLPKDGHKVADIESLLNDKNWNGWMTSYQPLKEVQFSMPKFTFAYEESLKNALAAMGMENAFTPAADFTGILSDGGLMISDVKHKSFIEVNEEGTEAAAVTSVEIVLTSIGNFISFNKPFLFAIAEKSTGSVLFLGKFMKPE
jgi:serpin B